MRFQRLDLNLLVALQALLSESSVTLAAQRLNLSQSATSSALSRLREYLGDELLVLKGRQMERTARAEVLLPAINAVLDQIQATITVPLEFDPGACDRLITIMASDYMIEVLLADVFRTISELAPWMRFTVQALPESPVEALERGAAEMVITLDYALSSNHPSVSLFEEDYVVVADRDNPLLADGWNMDRYLTLDHVGVSFGRNRHAAFDSVFMRSHGLQRRLALVVPSFTAVPGLIVGSKRITTMHRRLADLVVRTAPLRVLPLPFDIPVLRFAAQWHRSNANDPALAWVVGQLQTAARSAQTPDNVVQMGVGRALPG